MKYDTIIQNTDKLCRSQKKSGRKSQDVRRKSSQGQIKNAKRAQNRCNYTERSSNWEKKKRQWQKRGGTKNNITMNFNSSGTKTPTQKHVPGFLFSIFWGGSTGTDRNRFQSFRLMWFVNKEVQLQFLLWAWLLFLFFFLSNMHVSQYKAGCA